MREYGRAAATLARAAAATGGGRAQFAQSGRAARLAKLALLAGQPGGLEPPSTQAPCTSLNCFVLTSLHCLQGALNTLTR